MREVLVKLADKLDQEGKFDLATTVDNVILSTAARNKAPLKDLDEDIKKDLLKFLHTVGKNIKDSMEALNEFFRRLRYFDINDSIKEMGLDKALKEMEKTHSCIDNAGKSMYTMAYGKKPSKSDIAQMAEDFGFAGDEKDSPLQFFERQTNNDIPENEEDIEDIEEPFNQELEPEEESHVDTESDSEEELEYFWKDDEDDEESEYSGELEESFEEIE